MAENDDLLMPEEGASGDADETITDAGDETQEVEAGTEETVTDVGEGEVAAEVEGEAEVEEEASDSGPSYIEAEAAKPRADVYSAMLILAFVLFGVAIAVAYQELSEIYKVF